MTDPFEPTVLNNVTLPNRFVRSATWEVLAAPGGHGKEREDHGLYSKTGG